MSFYYAILTFKLIGYKLSLPGRIGHFTTPSGLLSGSTISCLYVAGHVILLRHPGF